MGLDEALLASASQQGSATLRFYQWAPATLSLGYFQRSADRQSHAASRAAPLVRRASGGGAILHDRELTYSLALPAAHPLTRSPQRVYDLAHQALVAVLAGHGVGAERHLPATSPAREPFLCFERRSRGDVVVADAKIAGSAQRRRAGAVLQHGSILLAASRWAPELPGLREVSGVELAPESLARELAPRLASALGVALSEIPLSPAEMQLAEQLAAEPYSAPQWTNRR